MEAETPQWLNEEFIQKALEHGKEFKVTVEKLKIGMPVAKGNNFMCDIFGVDAQYRISNDSFKVYNKSLIIKVPKNGPMLEELLKSGAVQKEPKMYNEFAPKLKTILCGNNQENCQVEDDNFILPVSYFTSEENVVILEDLKPKGFKMVNRLKQLDYDHCVLALKSLAKFHAGSVVIAEKDPEFIKDVGKESFLRVDASESSKFFFIAMLKTFIEGIKNQSETEKYANWFEENLENYFVLLINSIKTKENEFAVLNHGDFWATNMLFKYNDANEPIDIKLIDLQVCRYTSPVIDIMYFMDSSVPDQVRLEKWDDLIGIYLKELNTSLERYGSSKRLEKSEFDKAYKERSYFRLLVATGTLAGCVADLESSEIFDPSEITEEQFASAETNPMGVYYKNKTFIKILAKRLEEFETLGLITAK